jgi:hypothetical protein
MTITAELIYFVLAVLGAAGGIYWRWGGAIGKVRDDLASHKLHVAETYVSKQGHRESTDLLMGAITEVKSAIDGTNQRIDRMLDQPKAQRRAG